MKRAFAVLSGVVLLSVVGAAASRGAPSANQSVLAPAVLKQMVEKQGGAILGGLDKVTARVTTIYAPLDVPVRFGSLQIAVRKCNKRPPEETPEQTVFLEIDDVKPDHSSERAFTGWMFWSSPARNALEHPVYDVWLKDCVTVGAPAPAPVDPAVIEPGVVPPSLTDPAPAPGEPAEPLSPRLPTPG